MNKFREFVGQIFREKVFCGLDIGTQRIKASLCRVQDADNFQLLAVCETETRGMSGASVNDIGELSGAVTTVIEGVSRRAKLKFRDIYLGIGGDLVEVRHSRAVVPLAERGNKVIVPSDVKNARYQARLLGVRLDEDVIDDLVRQFRVDDINIALNPVGLYGRKLEVESLLVVASLPRLRNVHKAVKQAGYEVSDVFFNGAALSEAVMDAARRNEGCAVANMGASRTELLMFKEGLLKHFAVIPFGGDTLTARISREFDIPVALAEDLKKSYGAAGEAAEKAGGEVLLKRDQGFVPVSRAKICKAVGEELSVFTEAFRKSIAEAGLEGKLAGGVVMAGGCSLMPGLMETVERSLGAGVTMARHIPGLNNASLYAVSTSIAEMGYKGSLRYVFDKRQPKDWWDAWKLKAEELCNEYF